MFAILPIIRRYHDAHVASAVGRLDFREKFRPSVTNPWNPCRAKKCNDLIFPGRSSLFALTVSFQKRVSGRKNCQKQLKRWERSSRLTPKKLQPSVTIRISASGRRHCRSGCVWNRSGCRLISHHAQNGPDIDGKHRAARPAGTTTRSLRARRPSRRTSLTVIQHRNASGHICQRRTRAAMITEVSVIVHEANHVGRSGFRAKQATLPMMRSISRMKFCKKAGIAKTGSKTWVRSLPTGTRAPRRIGQSLGA